MLSLCSCVRRSRLICVATASLETAGFTTPSNARQASRYFSHAACVSSTPATVMVVPRNIFAPFTRTLV